MSFFFRTYRTACNMEGIEERIDGVFALVWIQDGDYLLQPLYVYRDGLIDCRGIVDFEGFKAKVHSGWVVVKLPDGARVEVSGLASFTIGEIKAWEDPEDFIKEVACQLDNLRGNPTAVDKCLQFLERYEREPSDENRRSLAEAYDAIPMRFRSELRRRPPAMERRVLAVIGELRPFTGPKT
jgi:hypothetical protein